MSDRTLTFPFLAGTSCKYHNNIQQVLSVCVFWLLFVSQDYCITHNITMAAMNLRSLQVKNGWEIETSPGDGHCLLHGVMTSWRSQLLNATPILLKEAILDEMTTNIDDYLAFGFEEDSLVSQMNSYIKQKTYNSDLGDLVPVISAKKLRVTIKVWDTIAAQSATLNQRNAANLMSITCLPHKHHSYQPPSMNIPIITSIRPTASVSCDRAPKAV